MRKAVWASLVLATVLGAAGLVSAHAEYDHSLPASGATVTAAPSTVQVWFTEELETKQTTAKVTDSSGAQVDTGAKVSLDTADHKLLVIALKPALPAGTYTVTWHSVAADDGHAADGNFQFSVAPATGGSTPPTAPPTTPAGNAGGSNGSATGGATSAAGGARLPNTGRGLGALALAGAALLVIGGALSLGRRKR